MRNLCLILALFLTGCGTVREMNSTTYHAGPFTMDLPSDLKQKPTGGSDSYIGVFESKNMYLTFDYGMSANNFEDWPAGTEYELVMIDEKEVRIGTINKGFRPGFAYSTQVSFRNTGGKYLTITAACKTKTDCARAKEIFRSVKFKPSSRD